MTQVSIDELRSQLLELNEQAKIVQANAEHRELTAEEEAAIDSAFSKFEQIEREIARREKLDRNDALMNKSQGRRSQPEPLPGDGLRSRNGRASAFVSKIMKDSRFQDFAAKGQDSTGSMVFDMSLRQVRNDLTSTQTGGSPGSGYDVQPQRRLEIGEDPRRNLRVLDFLPHLMVNSNSLEFHELSGYSNAANFQVFEGDLKAEASVPLSLRSAPIRQIAHWIRVSRQVLDDAPLLDRYVSSLLSFGVLDKLEAQVVAGTTQINGLLNQANVFVPIATKAADQISETSAHLETLGWRAGLVILHPTDWHKIRTERDTEDGYVTSGWQQPPQPNVWGLPVVTTPSLTAGQALVLDPQSCAILDRSQVMVRVSGEGHDNMTHNLVTILAELRAGLAVFSNGALLKVTLTF